MNIICAQCKQTFLSTSREPQYDTTLLSFLSRAWEVFKRGMNNSTRLTLLCCSHRLTLHAVNKHNATLPQCFPDFKPAASK